MSSRERERVNDNGLCAGYLFNHRLTEHLALGIFRESTLDWVVFFIKRERVDLLGPGILRELGDNYRTRYLKFFEKKTFGVGYFFEERVGLISQDIWDWVFFRE